MEKQSESKKKNKVWVVLVQLLIGGAVGFIAGIFIVDKMFSDEWSMTKIILFVLFLFIAIFANINIHEFGHFIFGKMLDYRLISYRISFLSWNNENGKMKFSIIKNKNYMGLCAMIPPVPELPGYKNVLFYAGGIILNVLSGLAFLLLTFSFPSLFEYADLFFLNMGIIALVLGVINFIPFISGNNPTDGKIIWSLILKKPFAKKLMGINKIASQLSAGIRPRDLQISSFTKIDNPQAFDMMIILYFYFKALDSRNDENMLKYANLLEKNIEYLPHHLLPSLYYELCYIGCIMNDEDKAKVYYEKGGMILHNDKDVNGLRVKAYYEYYVNKDEKSALTFCENALGVADRFPIKGQGLMEKDLVYSLKELIVTELV